MKSPPPPKKTPQKPNNNKNKQTNNQQRYHILLYACNLKKFTYRGLLDKEEINKVLTVLQSSDAMMKENYEVCDSDKP